VAGLVPAIHVFFILRRKDVDARHEAGHDGHPCCECELFAIVTPLPATNRAGRIAAILVDATCRFVSLLSSGQRDANLIRQQRRSPGAPIATVKF